MASQLARLAAMYSASVELNATDHCFRLNHDTTVELNPKQHPEVLFYQKHNLPNQNQCNLSISLHPPAYNPEHNPLPPYKYRKMCFAATQCTLLGSHMNWLIVLTAKHISGLVLTKYIKEPIHCLYKVGFTDSESEA